MRGLSLKTKKNKEKKTGGYRIYSLHDIPQYKEMFALMELYDAGLKDIIGFKEEGDEPSSVIIAFLLFVLYHSTIREIFSYILRHIACNII